MVAVLPLLLALQSSPPQVGTDRRSDSLRQARRDSIRTTVEGRIRNRERTPARRLPVTPELERTAFLDPHAREILVRAREARMRQDSSLRSYDATSYQRVSVGVGFKAIGRDRLLFRTESASRVRWSRDGGAWVEIKGRRMVSPTLPNVAEIDPDLDLSPLPYVPGREQLWIGAGRARAEVDERELIHPIAIGSEAYYRYATGDSIAFTLPDKKVIRLQELRVEPRRPEWRLSVGAFWFDAESGQLVRAVYRLAVPLNVWTMLDDETRRDVERAASEGRTPGRNDDGPPRWVRGLMTPLEVTLESVTIEYGLYGTRFWLPRAQHLEGFGKAGFVHVPVKMEASFKYASVNGDDSIPPVPARALSLRDSLFAYDTTRWSDLSPEERRRRARVIADAAIEVRGLQRVRQREECERTGLRTSGRRSESGTQIVEQIPCDTTKLATSPELAASIYDPGEATFGEKDRLELLKSLDFSLQPAWAPQPIVWDYGFALTRYNRVEGLSSGIAGSTQLGRGYAADGTLRLGTGDWSPNVDVGLSRSNGRTTWRAAGYRMLAAADDRGSPLGFGAGLGALLFGRDDGFYYRTAGAQLERSADRGSARVKVFGEYDSPASVTTTFSIARAFGSAARFRDNFVATRGGLGGLAVRDARTFGLNPKAWRAFTDVGLEAGWFAPSGADAAASHLYGRSTGDLTITRGLGDRLSAALTLGCGVSDHAPVQREFFVGGTYTVRGQLPGTQVGEAFWLGRLELGGDLYGTRPVVFGDLGWAGPRSQWKVPGRPMSGAGVGVSLLDGLIRADLARGIYPRQRMRFDLYVEARY